MTEQLWNSDVDFFKKLINFKALLLIKFICSLNKSLELTIMPRSLTAESTTDTDSLYYLYDYIEYEGT